MQPNRTIILLLTLVTGASGLIQQVIWQRYLGRLLGNDALATSTTLAVFLSGLALGYAWWGQRTTTMRSFARSYGIAEAIIAGWAFAFPWLFLAVESLSRKLPSSSFDLLLGVFWAALLLGVPTVAMGATLPLLTRWLSEQSAIAGRRHAQLYAVNTLGAVAGSLLAGLLLIDSLGLQGALRLAGAANLVAALYFLRQPTTAAVEVDEDDRPTDALFPMRRLGVVAFVSGATFMTLESVAVRWTHLSLGASSINFSLVIAAFVASIAIGSAWVARQRARRPQTLPRNLAAAILVLALAFPLIDSAPWAAWKLRALFGDDDFIAFHLALFGGILVTLLIPGALLGATLPLAFDAAGKTTREIGRRAGTLLAWNALGSLLGAIGGGYLLLRWLDLGQAYLVACWLLAIAFIAVALRGSRVLLALPILALLLVTVLFPYDPLRFAVGTFRLRGAAVEGGEQGPQQFFEAMLANRTIIAYRDAPEGSFAVVENLTPSQLLAKEMPDIAAELLADTIDQRPLNSEMPRSIVVNGKSDSSTFYDRETLRLSAHLPAIFGVVPERCFVVGLGTGVTAGELTLYRDLSVLDVAEISPTVGSFLPFFGEAPRGLQDDPRYRPHYRDAFHVLSRATVRYDAIISEPSNPWVVGVDQLFSDDFYRLAASRLEEDGLFVQWLQRYATTPEIYATVQRSLRRSFPYVRVFRGSEHDDLIVASRRPLETTTLQIPEDARASLEEIGILTTERILQRERNVLPPPEGAIERLDRPRIHGLSSRAFYRGTILEEPDSGL